MTTNQSEITASELLSHPSIAPLIEKESWSEEEKKLVAELLKSKLAIDSSGLSSEEEIEKFNQLWGKITHLVDTDIKFRKDMDPVYLLVDSAFPAPESYRVWLDEANRAIGGKNPADSDIFGYVVGGLGQENEPLQMMDPFKNIYFLKVDTRTHGDYVAGVLHSCGMHTWLMETATPALYR